jgi:hypothetical protein
MSNELQRAKDLLAEARARLAEQERLRQASAEASRRKDELQRTLANAQRERVLVGA